LESVVTKVAETCIILTSKFSIFLFLFLQVLFHPWTSDVGNILSPLENIVNTCLVQLLCQLFLWCSISKE